MVFDSLNPNKRVGSPQMFLHEGVHNNKQTNKQKCNFKKGFHPTVGNNGNIFSAFDGIWQLVTLNPVGWEKSPACDIGIKTTHSLENLIW